ncbi:hypothetical protein [Marinicella sp. W31]|uniref:hypothetical protein n=1 Tax=Marinicella sp. W31 TaxID=3023713 RepID=UPI003757F23C
MKYLYWCCFLLGMNWQANAQDLIFRSSFQGDDVNVLSFGILDADLSVSSEVIRIPASDATASDSETQLLPNTGADILRHGWEVIDAITLRTVFTSTQSNPTFTCPQDGRGAYDVRLTVETDNEYSVFRQRRLITCVLPRSDAGRTVHTIDLSTGSTYFANGEINGVVVQPGDLVRISGSAPDNQNLQFLDFRGTPEAPIHFINEGLVTHDDAGKLLHLINCEHMILDGKGSAFVYGFHLSSNNGSGETAVFVRGKTTGIEIYGVKITVDSGSGIEVNTRGTDDYNRSNWQHDNLRIHHNYVAAAHHEGFYIGYTNDNNDNPPDFWAAYQIHDGKIYRNRIENTGWDGLQVANMVSGMEVHDNFVQETGLSNTASQKSAYQQNAGNGGYVYNNILLGGIGGNVQQGETGGETYFFSNVLAGNVAAGQNQAVYGFGGPSNNDSYYWFSNTLVSPAHGFRLNSQRGELNHFTLTHNLFLLGAVDDDVFQFATPAPGGTVITTTPNLQRAPADDADLCLVDRSNNDFRINCAQSAALDSAPMSLDTVFPVELIPFKQHMDITGRVFNDTNSYGAYWSTSD